MIAKLKKVTKTSNPLDSSNAWYIFWFFFDFSRIDHLLVHSEYFAHYNWFLQRQNTFYFFIICWNTWFRRILYVFCYRSDCKHNQTQWNNAQLIHFQWTTKNQTKRNEPMLNHIIAALNKITWKETVFILSLVWY